MRRTISLFIVLALALLGDSYCLFGRFKRITGSISRTCNLEIELVITEIDNVTKPPQNIMIKGMRDSAKCGRLEPNKCRADAGRALASCVRADANSSGDVSACNGVDRYLRGAGQVFNNIRQVVERQACQVVGYRGRVAAIAHAVIHGDVGCDGNASFFQGNGIANELKDDVAAAIELKTKGKVPAGLAEQFADSLINLTSSSKAVTLIKAFDADINCGGAAEASRRLSSIDADQQCTNPDCAAGQPSIRRTLDE